MSFFEPVGKKPDRTIYEASKARWDAIAKPLDGLGDLEEMISRIASIQGKVIPDLSPRALIVLCADNGVVCEGVTQCDQKVTADVARLLGRRQSSVCAMTRDAGVDVIPVDIGIDSDETFPGVRNRKVQKGTGDIVIKPAMSQDACEKALQTGMELMDWCQSRGYAIVATGEMGIGNTTTATALLCALTGISPEDVTGRGAGLTEEGLQRKIKVIGQALRFHGFSDGKEISDPEKAFHALQSVGGLDLAGLIGLFLGGARNGIPVVIDGLISAVAALTAEKLCPGTADFMLASHTGKEQGTARVLERLKRKAVIDANLSLGEGTGAVLLFPLLDMALSLYRNGIRFDDTAIDAYERLDGK